MKNVLSMKDLTTKYVTTHPIKGSLSATIKVSTLKLVKRMLTLSKYIPLVIEALYSSMVRIRVLSSTNLDVDFKTKKVKTPIPKK